MSDEPPVEELSLRDCWALLGTVELGRLAVVVKGRPDIFPVNFAVSHGDVVLRTASGTKLAGARSSPVAFEADGVSEDGQVWSVVLRGGIEPPRHVDDLLDSEQDEVHPAQGSRKVYQVRINAEVVTGRRFTPVPGSVGDGESPRSAN